MKVQMNITRQESATMYEHATLNLEGAAGVVMHVPRIANTAMGPIKPKTIGIWVRHGIVPMMHTTRKYAAEWLRDCRKHVRRHRTLDA